MTSAWLLLIVLNLFLDCWWLWPFLLIVVDCFDPCVVGCWLLRHFLLLFLLLIALKLFLFVLDCFDTFCWVLLIALTLFVHCCWLLWYLLLIVVYSFDPCVVGCWLLWRFLLIVVVGCVVGCWLLWRFLLIVVVGCFVPCVERQEWGKVVCSGVTATALQPNATRTALVGHRGWGWRHGNSVWSVVSFFYTRYCSILLTL